MSLRILIVPDKFKGTLSAPQAAEAIAQGWAGVRPQDRLETLPMSDGGEGFGEILGSHLRARRQTCRTTDAAGRPRTAEWGWQPATGEAVAEAAQVNGLALLPPGLYHPFQLDTFGLGAVLQAARQAGARHLCLGLGGSATNDGGFGLARALGWIFRADDGAVIRRWTGLDRLADATPPPHPPDLPPVVVAVDVANPLLGPSGATRVYGPQKGLRPDELDKAEGCLRRLAETMRALAGRAAENEPGAGAAGGLGYGLTVFAGGGLQSGAALFARHAGLEDRIRQADLVIAAEGRLDAQSFMGKGVGFVADLAARAGKPCLCLAGSIAADFRSAPGAAFHAFAIAPGIAAQAAAMAQAAECLRRLAAETATRASGPLGLRMEAWT